MEKVCKNCEFFVQISRCSSTQNWGDCSNPVTIKNKDAAKKMHTFTWQDKTCDQFKTKNSSDQLSPETSHDNYCI